MHYKCFFLCVFERDLWKTKGGGPPQSRLLDRWSLRPIVRGWLDYLPCIASPPLSPAFTTTVPSIYWSTHNDSIYLADLGLLEVLFNFRYRPSANFTSLSGPCRQMTHGGALITDSLSLYLWNSIINTQENKKIKLHVPILSYLFT